MNELIPINYNSDRPTVSAMEQWNPVKGYEGFYSVSNLGNVLALDRYVLSPRGGVAHRKKAMLKQDRTNRGYLRVRLYDGCGPKAFFVHRLVAEAFLANPEGKQEVNHLNGVKHDNRACNLEWVTKSENELHAYSTGLKRPPYSMSGVRGSLNVRSKTVIQYDISGKEIQRFYGTGEAARLTGSEQSSIVRCANGKLKTHNGFRWEYAI